MASNPRVFINPFAIPSKANNSKPSVANLSNHQNAKQSLASFMNYNPTLSQPLKPIITHQKSPLQPHNQYYNDNYNNNKRRYNQMNNNYNNNNDYNNDYNNNYNNNYNNKRRKRQKYPNDGGLTDYQYQRILEVRETETKEDILSYIQQRKRNYPSKTNVSKKRDIIDIKRKRGQALSISEKIMKYQDDTGNKKTPSVLRFLKTPKFSQSLVRKVLHKEIEQEYSAVLQCFRYIIKTNYLTQDVNQYHYNDHFGDSNDTMKDVKVNELPCAFNVEDIKKDEMMMEQEEDVDLNIDLDFDCIKSVLAPQTTKRVN